MKTIEELKSIIQAGKDAERELEARGRVKFREGEVVRDMVTGLVTTYVASDAMGNRYRKLTLEELVLSMAPPEAVRWIMCDSDCVMFFDRDNVSFDCIVLNSHMALDDWESCGGEL
jgi:hypothetical protein